MIFLPSALYQHVIHIDLDIPPNLLREHFVHESLIRCACGLQTEGHHLVTEEALAGYERRFLLIGFMHSDLVVPRESVHEAQQLVSSRRVY